MDSWSLSGVTQNPDLKKINKYSKSKIILFNEVDNPKNMVNHLLHQGDIENVYYFSN
jgi:hypothetical protein